MPAKHIHELIASRRALLGGLAGLPLLPLATACASATTPSAAAASATTPTPVSFQSVAATTADTITVPPGYRAQTLIAWGDALFDNMAPFDPATVTRAEQEKRFGQNNDMLALFPAEYAFPFPTNGNRFLLCANNEYFDAALLFPQLARANDMTPPHWEAAFAAVGCSVVQVERTRSGWRIIKDRAPGAGRNRRVTPFSPVIFSGPAASHRWITAGKAAFNAAEPAAANAHADEVRCGTLANCAGGRTPWGTYLSSEENLDRFFVLNNASTAPLAQAQADGPWLLDAGSFGYPLFERKSAGTAPSQFDVSANPYGPALYGWVVEIDPYDPSWTPRKRTALGRKKGECATTALTRDGRVSVYMGDDQIDEFLYKFVSRNRFDPNNRTANRDLLDDGQLYVARLNEDGTGDWLPLTLASANAAVEEAPFHARFEDEADLHIRAREAARLLGATPMDRPEDFEAVLDDHWVGTGAVIVACTYNRNSEFYRPGNPRRGAAQGQHVQQPNVGGHILRLDEDANDAGAMRFRWDVFALAGDPDMPADFALPDGNAADVSVTLNGQATISGDRFACPDNLCFDTSGNVWIATDGVPSVFPDCNDVVMVAPLHAPAPRAMKRFLVAPVGAEVCGPTLALDETAFLCSIQHPGDTDVQGTSISELRYRRHQRAPSNWPDGGDAWPRSAVVVVTREDGGKVGA